MNYYLHLLIGMFLIMGINSTIIAQDIVINELMTSNSQSLQDQYGEFSDWIELYNNSDYGVSLDGWFLSDDNNNPAKYQLKDVVIPEKGCIVIFASGRNCNVNGEIHTNFKLKRQGEQLILSNPDMHVISSLSFGYLHKNQSCGSTTDGDTSYAIFVNPTPGASNNNASGIYCSHHSGFYTDPFSLSLNTCSDEETIRYTLDGSEPTDYSDVCNGQIAITAATPSLSDLGKIPTTPLEGPSQLDLYKWIKPENYFKGTVIRYALFRNGKKISPVYTKTFFITNSIKKKYSFPVISITTPRESFFDYDTGIYVPGKRFDENGFEWYPDGNYNNKGDDWERKIHIAWIDTTGNLALETDAGIRMHGNKSKSFPQKSLRLYFREEYGLSDIEYPVFNNTDNQTYKRLILRNGGNDFLFTHFRDAVLHDILEPLDLETQPSKPVIVFLNGEYWGIHNVRERFDKYYFKYHFDTDEDEVNILEICGNPQEGSNSDYNEVIHYLKTHDMTLDEHYSHICQRIDINNFINFQIAEIFYANYDWPCNNFKQWKDNAPENKWRFLVYDLDYSFAFNHECSVFTASMEHATSLENEWPFCTCSNQIFRILLTNDAFAQNFLQRFNECLRTIFATDHMAEFISSYEKIYEPEIAEHINRWGYPENKTVWEENIDAMYDFASQRPCIMAENIISWFNLPTWEYDCTAAVHTENNLILYPNPNNGNFALYNASGEKAENGILELFDSNGHRVLQKADITIAAGERTYFNYTHIPAGIYQLTFKCSHFSEHHKMIIFR